jgi:hypothetical protein
MKKTRTEIINELDSLISDNKSKGTPFGPRMMRAIEDAREFLGFGTKHALKRNLK